MKLRSKYFLTAATVILWGIALSLVFAFAFGRDSDTDSPTHSLAVEGQDARRRYNVLILGSDDTSGLCDVIMLASYDEAAESVNIVQIPRDTYARYSDSSYRKLNGAKNKLGGERAFCDFLSRTLCVKIDYYLSIGLDAVEEAVDALGGVEVDVPCDMDYEDPAQELYIHIKKGRRVLDGKAARQFVRYRSGYLRGDVGRIDAQKLFIASLLKEVKTDASVINTVSVALRVSDDVRTDMPFTDMISLARRVIRTPSENIRFVTFAGEEAIAKQSGASYYVISRAAAIEIVNTYLGGSADEESFDREKRLLNDDYLEFKRIYFSSAQYSVSNAAALCEDGIDIQHK